MIPTAPQTTAKPTPAWGNDPAEVLARIPFHVLCAAVQERAPMHRALLESRILEVIARRLDGTTRDNDPSPGDCERMMKTLQNMKATHAEPRKAGTGDVIADALLRATAGNAPALSVTGIRNPTDPMREDQ
jgi:hypothetical protein